MYAIQGRPKNESEDWKFCTDADNCPYVFGTEDVAYEELDEWYSKTHYYRIVKVKLIVVEE